MSYQVLARKWRPHNFKEVVGQQHVLTALINALDQDRLHHAYLLSGTRGVGKTTIARIFAKSLNCEQGISSEPCGQCSTCVEIDQGAYVDLLEIDAASRTKVEDTRELLDNVQYKPARGRFKVYLIDEVHMLSKHSFNALLKTLEEPPEYVKFLLATTDPQKLPITILSRCLQFHLKCLTTDQISKQLIHILPQEDCQYELSAISAIAKAADGSMRDALSLTDQALSHGSGKIEQDAVLAMLGTLDHRHTIQLLQSLVAGDANACMAKIAEVSLLGPDYDQLHIELASLLHRIGMAQILPSSVGDVDHGDIITQLAQQMSPEDVQLYYQISITGRKELPLAPDPRSALEMTVLRLLAFRPQGKIQRQEQPDVALGTHDTSAPQAQITAPITETRVTETRVTETAVVEQAVTAPTMANAVTQDVAQTAATAPTNPAATAMNTASQQIVDQSSYASQQPVHMDETQSQASDAELQQLNAEQADIMQAASGLGHITSEPMPAPAPSTANQEENSITQVRKTRNFLRSRMSDSAKKQIATKDESAPSSPYVPPAKPVKQRPVVNTAPQPPVFEQELPPIEAYQDQSFSSQAQTFSSQEQYGQYEQHEQQAPYVSPEPRYNNARSNQSANTGSSSQIERFSHVDVDINDLSPAFQPTVTPAATQSRAVENKLRDESNTWCRYINEMQLGGRVRLMALHSTMTEQDDTIRLMVSAQQRHSVNDKSKQQLLDAIRLLKGDRVELEVVFGEDSTQETPAVIEEKIYQVRLANATSNLYSDKNVQFFINRFGAVLDDSTIAPL